jgi:hypothetical protein
MRADDSWRRLTSNDLAVLVLWATAGVLLHTVTNGQYDFYHDELATVAHARLDHELLCARGPMGARYIATRRHSQDRIVSGQSRCSLLPDSGLCFYLEDKGQYE